MARIVRIEPDLETVTIELDHSAVEALGPARAMANMIAEAMAMMSESADEVKTPYVSVPEIQLTWTLRVEYTSWTAPPGARIDQAGLAERVKDNDGSITVVVDDEETA